jgi:chromate transporter
MSDSSAGSRTSLGELALLFLRLGTTAFGGPAAHTAMMREEVVVRRRWLDDAAFMDLVSATNLIPGPNSTELAIHIGQQRRGFIGLVVAGLCFIVPAALLTVLCAMAWQRSGEVPAVAPLLAGIKPVMLAIVVHALWGLAPKAVSTWRLRLLAALAVAVVVAGGHELLALFGAGLLAILSRPAAAPAPSTSLALTPWSWSPLLAIAAPAVATTAPTLTTLFSTFAWIGSVLFGSGYVLLAFLRSELVERLGWLTEAQLLDAIAIGQITPGPVFTTATFVGWVLLGGAGAVVATAGIFLPAFVFVALSGPLVPRLRASRIAGDFLDGVNAASLALMAVVSAQLLEAAVVDVVAAVVFGVALVLLRRTKVNPTWLILGGAVVAGLRAFAVAAP